MTLALLALALPELNKQTTNKQIQLLSTLYALADAITLKNNV